MADQKQIPELVNELYSMSKEYLLQETVEPAKKLGAYAGLSLGGAMLLGVAALFGVLAVYALFQAVLPATPWFNVLARGLTVVASGLVAGLIVWRMTSE